MMNKSSKRSDVCLLRKPLPPSDYYKTAFQTSPISYSSTLTNDSLPDTHPPLSAQCVNRVPYNTPYRRPQHRKEEEETITIHPLLPKGPPPLPPGKILSQRMDYLSLLAWPELEETTVNPPPEFTFNDFLRSPSNQTKLLKTNRATISRENYLKLTSWFATQKPTQTELSTWQANSKTLVLIIYTSSLHCVVKPICHIHVPVHVHIKL